MAGSIGTQRRLGGKDAFNPLHAMSFLFAPLSVFPAQYLLASPELSLQLMSSQMFGLNRVLRLVLPLDLVVLALGALGAQLGASGSSPPDLLPIAIPGSLYSCPHGTCCYKHRTRFGEKKILLGRRSECLAAPASFGFQQKLQTHGGGKPGCPVTAKHWDWERRLNMAGTEVLATCFCPLGPWEMGVLQKKEAWSTNSPLSGLSGVVGGTPGDGELGEQRVAGCRHVWLLGEHPPADAEVPVHPPPSLAPGDAGAGICWDAAHQAPTTPLPW